MTPEQTRLRALVATHTKRGDQEAVTQYRRELKVANLTEHIRRLVDSWPPFTNEQREQLAALLCPEQASHGRHVNGVAPGSDC